jgi:solute carrier family 15 (peptide/histidine transporter), member 3/4
MFMLCLLIQDSIYTGNECCERLAYYGMSTNLVLYFKERLHQHSAVASKNVSNWAGTCYITPLIGAFVADSYLGRYWTIASFSILYVIVSIVTSICTGLVAFQ